MGIYTGTNYKISGRIAVAGGIYPVPDNLGYLYNPTTNSWGSFPDMTHATRDYARAQLDGYLYALGGYDYSNNIPDGANFNQRYDATTPIGTPTNTPTGTLATDTPTHTNTATATTTSTPCGTDYNMATATATIVPGTTDTGNNCDDCDTNINLPFPYALYGQSFTTVSVNSNGRLDFVTENDPGGYTNECLPATPNLGPYDYTIFAHWDDRRTDNFSGSGEGIFTSISGTAPNRIFNIEWRTEYYDGGGTANYEVRLYEGQPKFDIIFGDLSEAGSGATVGVQGPNDLYTEFECDSGGLTNGLEVTFTQALCGTATTTPSATPTTGTTATPTATVCASGWVTGTASIIPGTDDTGNHCDDCVTNVTLPFSFQFYDQTFTSVNVVSNGNLQFNSVDDNYDNACLPDVAKDYAMLPYWDDLRTDDFTLSGEGIYTSLSGSTPNRIFNIEWRAEYYDSGSPVNFEVRLYEGTNAWQFIYGDNADEGASATVGIQKDTGSEYAEFECSTGGIIPGMSLTYAGSPCGTATPTNTAVPATNTSTPVSGTDTPTNTP